MGHGCRKSYYVSLAHTDTMLCRITRAAGRLTRVIFIIYNIICIHTKPSGVQSLDGFLRTDQDEK